MPLNEQQQRWNKNLEEQYEKEKPNMKKKNIEKKEIVIDKRKIINEFEKLKKEFFQVDTDVTLKKWKILSKAYELGKQVRGDKYLIFNLSEDFDIPHTTTRRIMSLNRATKKTWELINQGKISAYKVALICMTKNEKYQNEIVKMVIKSDFSCAQIKELKIGDKGDVKKANLKATLEKGFSKKNDAYRAMKDTLDRLFILLNMKKEDMPDSRTIELIELMENVKNKLQNKINEFSDLDVFLNDRDDDKNE